MSGDKCPFVTRLGASLKKAGRGATAQLGRWRVRERTGRFIMVSVTLIALVSVGAAVLASPLASAVVSWEYDQIRPAAAFNSAANQYLVVWEDHHWGWGADSDIYGQRLQADGTHAGSRFAISWDGSQHRLAPDVAYDSDHNQFLVVWEYAAVPDDHDIYARLVDWDGSLLAAVTVSLDTHNESNPVVAYNAFVDEFLVVWERQLGGGEFTQHDIYAQRILASGAPAGSAFAVANSGDHETAPDIIADTQNHRYLVVWQARASSGHDDIRGRRVGADGSLMGTWVGVSTRTGDQRRPRVAYNRLNDQFFVVWQDLHLGAEHGWDVYGQRVGASGTLTGSPIPVAGDGEPRNQTNPDVTYDPTANAFVVAWDVAYSEADLDVYRRVVGSDGSLPDDARPIAFAASYEGEPVLAAGLNSTYLAAWEDGRNDATLGLDIYGETKTLALPLLSGRVYAGEPEGESTPLEGVTVELYCSADQQDQGWLINRTTTNADGWYGLMAGAVCEYYNIVELDPPWYTSAGASSVDGAVITDNWIQYDAPLTGETLTGNRFWDVPPPTTTECDSCESCSAKLNGSYDVVQLNRDLTGVVGGCIDFGSGNTTFDCQGHRIQTDESSEFDYGVGLVGVSGAAVRDCAISGFETGIRLVDANNNDVISNTITGAGSAVYLARADANQLLGNHITQNGKAVWGTDTGYNSFRDNVMCQQAVRDMEFSGATARNTRSTNKCDAILNWNGDDDVTWCDEVCTPNVSVTCSTAAEVRGALDGGYSTVRLDSDVTVPGGLVVNGHHVTIDCQDHALLGDGTGTGLVLDNRLNVTVQNCTVQNHAVGIRMRSTAHSHVLSNDVNQNTIGIQLGAADAVLEAKHNTVSNNRVQQNALHGVELADAVDNTISANHLVRNDHHGLWVTGEGCDNSVMNNVSGDGGPLLYLHDTASPAAVPSGDYGEIVLCNVQNAVVNNVSLDNGTEQNDGILLVSSSDNEIGHSILVDTRGILALDSDDLSIHHNDISDSASEGIRLDSSLRAQVQHNALHDNQSGAAILVRSLSHQANLVGNTIEGNLKGVDIKSADDVVLQANSISENDNEGVDVAQADGAQLDNNDITLNHVGVMFRNTSSGCRVENNKVCYNETSDIYDNGVTNTGDENTCALAFTWRDDGVEYPLSGCDQKCIGFFQYNYGYRFDNPSQSNLTFGCPFGSCQGDYVDTFGEDEVYVTAKVCIGVPICIPFVKCWCGGYELDVPTPVPDPHASKYYGMAYFHAGRPGECTGVSTTSLQFYHHDRYLSNYDPSAGKVSDLTHAGSVENIIDAEHGGIVSAEFGPNHLGSIASGGDSPNKVLTKVKQAVDSGELGSLVMHNKTEAHTVVATNYRDSGNTARIYIYDSNIPDWSTRYASNEQDYPHVMVDKLTDTWSSPDYPEYDSIYFVPYSVSNGPFTIPFGLNHIFNWGSADAEVEDSEGNRLRWVDGELVDEIPGAAPVPAWGSGSYGDDHQGYMLPEGEYTVHIEGRESGTYSTTVFAQNAMAVLHGRSTGPSGRDALHAEYERGSAAVPLLTLTTEDAAKLFSLLLGEKFGKDDSTRIYSLQNATISDGAPAVVRVSPDYDALIYTNRGNVDLTYDVAFRNTMMASEGQVGDRVPEAVRTGLVIGPMESHVIRPDDWLNLSTSSISIDVQLCGDGVCGEGEDPVNCPEECPEASCAVPHDDMHVTDSVRLCPGTYELHDQGQEGVVIVDSEGATLDCDGAQLQGDGSGVGILVSGTGASVENCQLRGYGTGVRLVGGSRSTLSHSAVMSSTTWAVRLDGTGQGHLLENVLRNNANGVHLNQASNTTLERNLICPNGSVDVLAEGGSGNTGQKNACDDPANWHDLGRVGCRFQCESRDTGIGLYLPLVIRSRARRQP